MAIRKMATVMEHLYCGTDTKEGRPQRSPKLQNDKFNKPPQQKFTYSNS